MGKTETKTSTSTGTTAADKRATLAALVLAFVGSPFACLNPKDPRQPVRDAVLRGAGVAFGEKRLLTPTFVALTVYRGNSLSGSASR